MPWHTGIAARSFVTMMAGGLIITLGGAWWNYRQTADLILSKTETEVDSLANIRLERESQYFAEAERLLRHLSQLLRTRPTEAPTMLRKTSDGTWRERESVRNGLPLTAFVTVGSEPSAELGLAWNLIAALWPDGQHLFPSLSIVDPGRWMVSCSTRAPELAESLLPSDPLLLPSEARLAAQPGDDPRWSASSFEPATGAWQTTLLLPVDLGKLRLALLLQVPLDQVIERARRDQQDGTTIILDQEGWLIHHPQFENRIRTAGGRLDRATTLSTADNALITQGLQLADTHGIISGADGSLAGVTRLENARITMITVFPADFLRAPAIIAARRAGLFGLVSTVLLALLVHLTLRHHVSRPLRAFIGAAEKLAAGERGVDLDSARRDELGELAKAMTRMDEAVTRAETDLKHLNQSLEERVEERTADLERLNQELEAFSYSVSHDLRAPLRRIDGFSMILAEDHASQLDADGQRHLATVRRQTQDMAQLIDDMLGLARVGRAPLRPQIVDLSTLCNQILATLSQAEPGRKHRFEVEPGLVVHGDPGLLRILCDNLLGNAWKYSAKTDCTEITVRRDIRSGSAGILFRDRGAGFDRARASRLFTPFQRYHQTEEFAGTGVGLATVQRIVNRHGGAISAESAPGHGAEFFLVLPGPEQPRRSPLTSTPT